MMNKLKELRHENGQFEPTQASLIQLADYFHVTIDYLLGRKIIKTEIGKSTKIPITLHGLT